MLIKVFFLGRPGSGKSTAARHMIELAERRNYSVHYKKDYDILYHMFKKDHGHKQFQPADYDGFDVIDKTVFDTALKNLEENILAIKDSKKKQLVAIEFARDDYQAALKLFASKALQGAYIFFVDANLQNCIDRIHKRVETPSEPDHHFVSDYIMKTYYNQENWMYVSSLLEEEYPFFKNVVAIRNTGSQADLLAHVDNFADTIFQNEGSQQKQQEVQDIDAQNNRDPVLPKKPEEHLRQFVELTDMKNSITPPPSSSTAYKQCTDELQSDPVVQAL